MQKANFVRVKNNLQEAVVVIRFNMQITDDMQLEIDCRLNYILILMLH